MAIGWHAYCTGQKLEQTRGMILLLGASGYYGKTFAGELRRRGWLFIPLTRKAFDYTRFDFLFDYVRTTRPALIINAAGYFGGGDQAEDVDREALMSANALLPQMIARVCLMTRTPWAHVSSGSIYTGLKLNENGRWRVERDAGKTGLSELLAAAPQRISGFNEMDEPNYSFRYPPCGFYSGTKALAEEAVREIGESYIWRLREPFNEREERCNLLMRLSNSGLSGLNSLSHLEDCVRACLDLWEYRAPFGIYNVVNPGVVEIKEVAQRLERINRGRRLAFSAASPPAGGSVAQPGCVLDASKLIKAGVKLRPLRDALADSLERLAPVARSSRVMAGASIVPAA